MNEYSFAKTRPRQMNAKLITSEQKNYQAATKQKIPDQNPFMPKNIRKILNKNNIGSQIPSEDARIQKLLVNRLS